MRLRSARSERSEPRSRKRQLACLRRGLVGDVRCGVVARLLTPRWLVRHAVVLLLVGVFLWLGWWQVRRAAGGNALSFGYAVEWPVFAVFVVAMWAKEVRAELRGRLEQEPPAPPTPQPDAPGYLPFRAVVARPEITDDSDPQLAAYNRYLGWLAANPDRRPADYPG